MVSILISIFSFPIFASYLSITDFGVIGYFNALKTFLVPMFALGMTNYTLMMYFRQNEEENKKTLFNIIFYQSIINIILIFACFFISKVIFHNFNIFML